MNWQRAISWMKSIFLYISLLNWPFYICNLERLTVKCSYWETCIRLGDSYFKSAVDFYTNLYLVNLFTSMFVWQYIRLSYFISMFCRSFSLMIKPFSSVFWDVFLLFVFVCAFFFYCQRKIVRFVFFNIFFSFYNGDFHIFVDVVTVWTKKLKSSYNW